MFKIISLSIILASFVFSCQNVNKSTQSKDVIGILPYHGMKSAEIDSVKVNLEITYGLKVVILNEVELPQSAYTTRRSPRYRADTLLRFQNRIKPDSISIIIGLTNKDISNTKFDPKTLDIKEPQNVYVDWGIFGLGQVGGESCVVSTYRLHNNVSKKQYFTRLNRISTHEVGHVLGLFHCPTSKCLMNDANETIKTIDKSTGKLCEKCLSKIN